MTNPPISESNFDHELRMKLISIIRRYAKLELVNLISNKLAETDDWIARGEFDAISTFQPWSLLLILELIFAYGEEHGQSVHQNTLPELVNSMHELSDFSMVEPSNAVRSAMKIIRSCAFQQFYFQKTVSAIRMSKEIWLFRNSPDIVRQQFQECYGYSPEFYYLNYFFFLIWTMGIAYPGERVITWASWANSLSLDLQDVRSYILRNIKRRRSKDEKERRLHLDSIVPPFIDVTWERVDVLYKSFFFDYPIIHIKNNEFLVPSKLVLQESLLKGPYRRLKAEYGQKFSGVFGTVFEKYLETGLKVTGRGFYTETDLTSFGFEKQVDFVIFEEKSILLMEAKAIEMTPYRQIDFSQQILEEGFKETILKGYTQLHYAADQFKKIFPDINIFALIVTYDDLFLGSGENIWTEWLQEAWGKKDLNKKFHDQEFTINPENVFVVSADTFDQLIRLKRPLTDFLQDCIGPDKGMWISIDRIFAGEEDIGRLKHHEEAMDWLEDCAPQLIVGLDNKPGELFKGFR